MDFFVNMRCEFDMDTDLFMDGHLICFGLSECECGHERSKLWCYGVLSFMEETVDSFDLIGRYFFDPLRFMGSFVKIWKLFELYD